MPINDPKPGSAQDQQRRIRAQLVGRTKREILRTARHEARRMDEEIIAKVNKMEVQLNRLIKILTVYLENVELRSILRKLSEEKNND